MSSKNSKQLQIVFNFDSTLVSIEGPIELAKHKSLYVDEIRELTEQSLRGEESFTETFRRRFELFRPSAKDLAWLSDYYLSHVVTGAKDAIAKLQEPGFRVSIVSASYRPAILKTARELHISPLDVCAVDLDFSPDGSYESFDRENILTTDEGLRIVLAEISKRGPVIFVGDSVKDAECQDVVDLFIGFGGVHEIEKVKKLAPKFAQNHQDVVNYILEFAEEEGYGNFASGSAHLEFSA